MTAKPRQTDRKPRPLRHLLILGAMFGAALAGTAAAQGVDIVLPEGAVCKAVSADTNVTAAGGAVSHFCDDGVALVGGLALEDAAGLVTKITYDPAAAQNVYGDELVFLEVRGVTLQDGSTCQAAGQGAALASGARRANYTCDDGAVLLGNFEQAGASVYAEKAAVEHGDDRLAVAGQERVRVTTIDASQPWVDVQWTLESFGEGGPAVLVDAPATMLVQDGRAFGATGCNQYFAGVAVGLDGAVTFGQAGSTMMFCQDAMDQEQRFLSTLAGVSTFELSADGQQLVLSGSSGELVFRR